MILIIKFIVIQTNEKKKKKNPHLHAKDSIIFQVNCNTGDRTDVNISPHLSAGGDELIVGLLPRLALCGL